MSTPLHTGGPPPVYSAEDIIIWTREEAYRMGEIGFTTNFPDTAANFSAWRCDTNAPLEPVDDEQALEDAADAFHNDVCKVQAHSEIMKNMPGLVAEAHEIVDAKLLAAGRPRREGEELELRQKVVELFELEHPPAPPNYVTVLVAQRLFTGTDELLEVNLPLKESLAGVYNLLKGAVELDACFKNPLGPKKEVKAGTWEYQVIYRDRSGKLENIDQPSVRLQSDDDYREMVQRITDGSNQAFHAVLTPVPVLQADGDGGTRGKECDGGESGADELLMTKKDEEAQEWDDASEGPG